MTKESFLLIREAVERYPVSVTYCGQIPEEDIEEMEKFADIHCFAVYMNGTAHYSIRAKKGVAGQ